MKTLCAVALAILLLAAPSEAGPITVSAAASLQNALKDIQPLFEKAHPGVSIACNFGGSGALEKQIENGAPADLFIAASAEHMDTLDRQGLLEAGTRRDLLRNQLVLIAPKDSRDITGFADLAGSKVARIAVGEPKSVPAGAYAEATLRFLKLFDAVKQKLIFTQDVRQALTYVETANVDAGFVYETDARLSQSVHVIAIAPEESHPPIVYPAAVIKNAKESAAAKELIEFLSGPEARAVFEKCGFQAASAKRE